MSEKKRLLITISFSFSIRYLYRTGMLHKLREFAHPVIALHWNEPELVSEMQAEGFEVHIVPVSIKDKFYANTRTKIDFWFDFFELKTHSKEVQKKYLNQYIPLKVKAKRKLRERYNQAKFFVPGYRQKLFEREQQMLATHTNYNNMLSLVDNLKIDAVFTITPFQTQEDILLRACKARNKKMITSIVSFDNITKRGWIPVPYDHYMVWNKYNFQELISIYPAAANEKNVTIVGAPQFDFYFDSGNLMEKNEWKKMTGLPENNRKIILYAGGPKSLFPNEPQYLKHIMEAISKGMIEGSPLVLFRCHPIDNVDRWKDYVGKHPNLFYDVSWTGKEQMTMASITNDDITKLCSTLAYTDVHINLCSTMTVDGSAYDKPQIGPYYDDVNSAKADLLRGMYMQKHFLPIIKTDGLKLASSNREMVSLINKGLSTPEKMTDKCEDILEEIITYTDGKSTERVVNVLREILNN